MLKSMPIKIVKFGEERVLCRDSETVDEVIRNRYVEMVLYCTKTADDYTKYRDCVSSGNLEDMPSRFIMEDGRVISYDEDHVNNTIDMYRSFAKRSFEQFRTNITVEDGEVLVKIK